jgi:hypothetical protein
MATKLSHDSGQSQTIVLLSYLHNSALLWDNCDRTELNWRSERNALFAVSSRVVCFKQTIIM